MPFWEEFVVFSTLLDCVSASIILPTAMLPTFKVQVYVPVILSLAVVLVSISDLHSDFLLFL